MLQRVIVGGNNGKKKCKHAECAQEDGHPPMRRAALLGRCVCPQCDDARQKAPTVNRATSTPPQVWPHTTAGHIGTYKGREVRPGCYACETLVSTEKSIFLPQSGAHT